MADKEINSNKERTSKTKYQISSRNVEYYISAKKYYPVMFIGKIFHSSIGIFLTVLLYNQCLFNSECNIVVTVFLAILALSSFQAAGFPIDKLANIKLT